MKGLIQRVDEANVEVNGKSVGKISKGLLVYVGVAKDDTDNCAQQLANKVAHLRIFKDDNGKLMYSTLDLSLPVLIVSQFTLVANTSKGRRPEFTSAARPADASNRIDTMIVSLKNLGIHVETGVFGEKMMVYSKNNGPINFLVETKPK
jgi:D-aminoacyl-tRNA deacylase